MNFFKLKTIRQKIIVPMVLFIAPLFTVGFILVYHSFYSGVRERVSRTLDQSGLRLQNDITSLGDRALLSASVISTMDGVKSAYREENNEVNRLKLRNYFQPTYDKIKAEQKKTRVNVHFHRKPAVSFLRTWQNRGKKDGGDDLSSFRKTILHVSRTEKPVTSVEVGRGGLVMRGISPVFSQGDYKGSVENFYNFNDVYKLIDPSLELTIYLNKDYQSIINKNVAGGKDKNIFTHSAGSYIYLSSSKMEVPSFIQDDFFTKYQDTIYEKDSTFAKVIPLKDFSGDIVAMMVLSYKVARETSFTVVIMGAVFLAMAVVIFIIVVIVSSRISRSVRELRDASLQVAEGNLSVEVEILTTDEVGELAGSLSRMVQELRRIIGLIFLGADSLKDATGEISMGNHQLARKMSQQAAALEEITSTIEEATSSINSNASNAQSARTAAQESTEKANRGGVVIKDAINAINEVSDSSQKIGEIIQVINEIAFQTNLLALNAAVEAARAGEAGRGFAVVAGEVRNLSQKTAVASREIEELIKGSLDKVERGTKLAEDSGKVIAEIIDSITQVADIIEEIAASSEEQRQGMAQINIAVTEMDATTHDNASMVEETASASETMAAQAVELKKSVSHFKFNKEEMDDNGGMKFLE